jgi:hypothetical protein
MDFIRVNSLCFCVLAFLTFSASASEHGAQSEVSASIQATATVISPAGLTESISIPDDGWLLYAPDPDGVLIQVSAGGEVVDEFGVSDDQAVCDELNPSLNPHIALVSCKRFADAMQNDTLAVVVTVVYPGN